MIPDFIKLEDTIAKSHKNRIRNSTMSPATDTKAYLLNHSWGWVSPGGLSNAVKRVQPKKDPRETWERDEGVLCVCVLTVSTVIGRAGSSWERPAGAVYGFHSDGLFLMPPSPNAYTGPSERGVQLEGDKTGRGMRKSIFMHLQMQNVISRVCALVSSIHIWEAVCNGLCLLNG